MATRKKEKRNVTRGFVHIQATFNNTLITITDQSGNTIAWSSSGMMKFRGSRKSTPYAAQVATRDAIGRAKEHGLREVEIIVKGPGIGRESAMRTIASEGLAVKRIRDLTPLAHNGCRPRKKRRV